jgi:hypothetical protein
MMKIFMPLLVLGCALPAFAGEKKAATRTPQNVQEDSMSDEEKTQLLQKLVKYRKRVTGANGTTVRSAAGHALKHLAGVDMRCDQFSPTTDHGKQYIMDCTARFPNADGSGLVELNFGTQGQLAETAVISDVTFKACANEEVQTQEGGEGPKAWCPEEAPRPVGLPVRREEPVRVGMPAPRGEEPVRVGMPAPRKEEPKRVGMPSPRPTRVGMPVQKRNHADEAYGSEEQGETAGAQ